MPNLEPMGAPAVRRVAPLAFTSAPQRLPGASLAVTMVLTSALACALPASAAHAAERGGPPAVRIQDPFEPLNRVLFNIHQALDVVVFRPAAMTYVRVVPPIIRHVLHNAVVNLGEPRTAVNDALQGRAVRTLKSVVRFTLNTTMGLAGLFDVAAHGGLPAQPNDFGITLAHLGVGSGPYFFIPLYGPTTLRDLAGDVADLGLNPLTYARYTGDTEVGVASVVSEGLHQRAAADGDLKALEASATDLYASFRSYYLQNREATITGGKIDLTALPDFGDDAPSSDAPAVTAQPPADTKTPAPAPPAASAPPSATDVAAAPDPTAAPAA